MTGSGLAQNSVAHLGTGQRHDRNDRMTAPRLGGRRQSVLGSNFVDLGRSRRLQHPEHQHPEHQHPEHQHPEHQHPGLRGRALAGRPSRV